MERSSGAVRTACDKQIDGRCVCVCVEGGGEAQAYMVETDRKTTESGSSWQLTLKKGAHVDQV